MRKASRVLSLVLACGILLVALSITGCTRHPNEDQLQALEEQKIATLAAEEQVDQVRQEKADLEAQLAKKKAELEKMKAEKAAVQQRLENR